MEEDRPFFLERIAQLDEQERELANKVFDNTLSSMTQELKRLTERKRSSYGPPTPTD